METLATRAFTRAVVKMTDSSKPPGRVPPGITCAAGYIGGDTPHVWTLQEWHDTGTDKKIPIFVRTRDGGRAQGIADAFAALEKMHELGVPPGSVVVYDIETLSAPQMVAGFCDVMIWAGFHPWSYGSTGNLFSNPPGDGYWPADPTGVPHLYPHHGVRATQYEENKGGWDYSVVTEWEIIHRVKNW